MAEAGGGAGGAWERWGVGGGGWWVGGSFVEDCYSRRDKTGMVIFWDENLNKLICLWRLKTADGS
jgi:hypothetical protein